MSGHIKSWRTAKLNPIQRGTVNLDVVADGDRLMRIKDVAEFMGTSDKTVRRLIDEGKLKSQKIRGLRFIWKSQLLAATHLDRP